MSEDRYTFEQARARLEEIVGQVRDRDTSLEASLDLLEESVRLANQCTELIDHTQWRTVLAETQASEAAEGSAGADEESVEPSGSEQPEQSIAGDAVEDLESEEPAVEERAASFGEQPDEPEAPEAQAV